MNRICIVAAKRTPIGKFLGSLAARTAGELGAAAAKAALASANISPAKVDQVIVGNVLSAGLGQSVARQVGIGAGVPIEVPAFTVNMMCASGLQAAVLAAQAIRAGDATVVLCGGTESMSNAPFLLKRTRENKPSGEPPIDSMINDGLSDAFAKQHMGVGAEMLAEKFKISRQEQDMFAIQSQRRWAIANDERRFADEIAPLDGLEKDEHPRPGTTLEKLGTLKPAFKAEGTVTPGNASGINDGAAMLLMCSEETAKREGWPVLAIFGASAAAGVEPMMFGIGPVLAIRKLTARLGIVPDDFDTIELNEAFAAQSLACIKELDLNADRTNVDGGAIAIGHPIGASGARLLVHLAHRVNRGESRRTLASLCAGGGMGIAAMVER